MSLPNIHSNDDMHLLAVCALIALEDEEIFYHIAELEEVSESDLEDFRDLLKERLERD